MEAASRAFSRLAFFPRTPRSSTEPSSLINAVTPPHHTRSTSLTTLAVSSSHKLHSTSSKWRPSVLGHFHQPSASQISIGTSEAQYTPSRPSISSGDTYTTSSTSRTTTTFDSNIPSTPSKLSLFDSIRLRGNKSLKATSNYSRASTSSVQLSSHLPTESTHEESDPASHHPKSTISQRSVFAPKPGSVLDNLEDDEEDLEPPPTYRFSKHASSRPSIPFSSSGTLPRVKFSSLNSRSHRKKKKLVISGIGVTEFRKLEGIRRWCEVRGQRHDLLPLMLIRYISEFRRCTQYDEDAQRGSSNRFP